MEFRLLGRLRVESDDRDLTPRRPRERAVLALLLLRHPRTVDVDELLDAVWGETPPPTARTALHGLVSGLRRRLGAERIDTEAPGYRIRLQPGDRIDLARFEALVEDAAAASAVGRAQMLREALDLFAGEPFGDADLEIDLHGELARLEGLRLAAEEGLIAAELELGRHREVLARLERLVADQPLREGLRAQLMVALYRAGRQADALRVAQDARTLLATELGVEPGPALQQLERQILHQDPALLGPGDLARTTAQVTPGGFATFLALLPSSGVSNETGAADLFELAAGHGGVAVPARSGTVHAFATAREAAAAAAAIQRAARRSGTGLRGGLHSGTTAPATATGVRTRMPDADHATRLADVAHPGQVVLSRGTRDLLRETPLHELDVRDLGDHRLADLSARQPLYQLVAPGLAVDVPPPRGLDDRRTNLPVQATPLIDREVDLDAITRLLRDPGVRCVTLTGPGGTGKTRVALHAAAELIDDAPDGTWFVSLEGLRDPALVAITIAATVGVAGEGPSAVGAIARELAGRRTLIVLDNFEHLLAAADVVGELLDAAPSAKILVTSRLPLKLGLERVVAIQPLPVPSAAPTAMTEEETAGLLAFGSVALFVSRAAAVRPGFRLTPDEAPAVVGLCRALDGLPLAIELAASRVGVMPPAAVLERLDRPLQILTSHTRPESERHHALAATIEWSHALLDSDTQRLFADLAVFAGGWALDGAEAVCGSGGGVDVINGLAGLVDHSLVRIDGPDADPRFGFLETIREHATGKLDASGRRPEVERRHANHLLALAEAAEPHLRGNPGPWLGRLHAELDNLRAALDRLSQRAAGGSPDAETEARLAGALWRFWYLGGQLADGRDRLEHAIAAYREPTATRVKLLIGAAVMSMNLEGPRPAAERAAEALTIARSLGDAWSAAYAQFMLGNAAGGNGDWMTARGRHEASLAEFRELGDEHSALLVARGLATALEELGEREQARALHQDTLRRARAAANGRLEASTLGALSTIAFDEGRVTDSTLMIRESLRLHRELGDRLDTAIDLARAARTLAIGGRPEESAQLLGSLSAVREDLGRRARTVAALADDTRAIVRRQLVPAELDRLVEEGARLRLDAAVELALAALS